MKRMFMTVLLASGCAASAPATKSDAPPKSLYDRLGGKEAITAVVADFVDNRVAKDDRINARFANADLGHLKAMLVDQICEASGGPCKYTGKDMKTSHTGMKVTDDEFTALVEDLTASLNQFKVGESEQKQLVGALAPMKPDIVNQ